MKNTKQPPLAYKKTANGSRRNQMLSLGGMPTTQPLNVTTQQFLVDELEASVKKQAKQGGNKQNHFRNATMVQPMNVVPGKVGLSSLMSPQNMNNSSQSKNLGRTGAANRQQSQRRVAPAGDMSYHQRGRSSGIVTQDQINLEQILQQAQLQNGFRASVANQT